MDRNIRIVRQIGTGLKPYRLMFRELKKKRRKKKKKKLQPNTKNFKTFLAGGGGGGCKNRRC
jgi:hypothetical protein